MLRDGVPYRDLGPQHFDERQRTHTIRRLLRRLQDLGCPVTISSPMEPSSVTRQLPSGSNLTLGTLFWRRR